MGRVALVGGAYAARSIIANAQRCINLYPEINPKDSPVPVTHYQRPGLKTLAQPTRSGRGRGLFTASNGTLFAVVGQDVYYVQGGVPGPWGFIKIGELFVDTGLPVSMSDNGTTLLMGDGSSYGYTITLGTNVFAQFIDPTGTFTGANKIDYIDTFLLWNIPGTRLFGSTLSNSTTIDPTYVAGKTGYPDPLQTLIVNHHVIMLLGSKKTEIWSDAGGALFPFAEIPGTYFEHGTGAIYSVAAADVNVYFLGQDLQGQGVIFRGRNGYDCRRISNHALEFAIRQMALGPGIADAIGYTWQQDGHAFYTITFPAGNQTWTFDESTEQWHQLAWTDSNGELNRHRLSCFAYANGLNVGLDWENGTLLQLDPTYYFDDIAGVPTAIQFTRSFPHIMEGEISMGAPGATRAFPSDGKRVQYNSFALDLECGNGLPDANGVPSQVSLRTSIDRGRSWGATVLQSTGAPGQYETQPFWRVLGISRDMVFEVSYNSAGETALNGAWVDAVVLAS